MKTTLAALCIITSSLSAQTKFDVAFSTYLGGSNFDAARDVAVDSKGNIIVVGGTGSDDLPVTVGAFQKELAKSTGKDSASRLGDTDAFIAKLSPAGEVIWCTYFGGPGYDRAYGVEVDKDDQIIIAGRSGPGMPTTKGSFQPKFIDTFDTQRDPGTVEYGKQNGFVACFTSGGERVWCSYVWYGQLCRDVAVDSAGDLYVSSGWNGNIQAPGTPPPPLSGFMKQPSFPLKTGGNNTSAEGDSCLLKVKSDGTAIVWGTWLCGADEDAMAATVRVDAQHNAYFLISTSSHDMPHREGDHGIHNHAQDTDKKDLWLGKVSSDGQQLIYGTYIGGNSHDGMDTHQLAVDGSGNAYAVCSTTSTNMPTTPGTIHPMFPPGKHNAPLYACKIGPDGALLHGTYIPASSTQQPEGVSVDTNGNLYFTGATHSRDYPVTSSALQNNAGEETNDYPTAESSACGSGFFTILDADFKNLRYSTCFGKGSCLLLRQADGNIKHHNAYGAFHASVLAPDGSIIVAGSWLSDGLPTVKATQSVFRGGPGSSPGNFVKHCDASITRFTPSHAPPSN